MKMIIAIIGWVAVLALFFSHFCAGGRRHFVFFDKVINIRKTIT
jgi:hypothetical protein